MTIPPPLDAWAIEADADLIKEHGQETDYLVTAWLRRHVLHDRVTYSTEHVIGSRSTGQQDTITLPGEATYEQVQQLAHTLGRVYDLKLAVRRVRLLPGLKVDPLTLQPTGEYEYVEAALSDHGTRQELDEEEV
ncbi:hypothetical protein E7T09_08515 [Deinococcus sp. KSM4-11]|uniref:hypothetical protein n=1 Tax=Deinococcus sp. KSM4-11 TaxID=2568654 RepID=UPI0010A58DCD|nr:hypothetical protein [Deinococcus sp. KSM4-11]THF87188.1 hypothetical protein E7T09_08515 [Deinococcus sp. KSM4-11]